MNDTVGLIGLGNAGAALATAFSGQRPLVGHDANPARRDAVAALDLLWADTPAAVAEQADIVLLSLPNPQASAAVVEALVSAAPRPQLIVETSTVTPNTAQALAAACGDAGIGFIDAAIGSGVQAMAAGKVNFLIGGADADVAAARPVLELVAASIRHLGPVGAGSGAKVVNNTVVHAVMVVLIEAAAMARKLDVPLDTLADILASPDGVTRPLQHRIRERVLTGNYEGGMSVSNARKDSVLALETAQDCGVPLFAMLASHTPYEIAAAEGMGELDYAALATLWENWCGIAFSDDR